MKRQDKNLFPTPSKWRRIMTHDDSDSSDSSYEEVYQPRASFGQDLPSVRGHNCFCGRVVCECARSTGTAPADHETENADNPSTSSGVRRNQIQEPPYERRSNGFHQYEAGPIVYEIPPLRNPSPDRAPDTSAVSFAASTSVTAYPAALRAWEAKRDALASRLHTLREWVATLNQRESSSGNNATQATDTSLVSLEGDLSLETTFSSQGSSQASSSNHSADQMRTEEDYKRLYEELHSGLVNLLECPVCMDLITPPIQQCRRGHLICSACKSQLHNCPSCRDRFLENRNLAMERVADKIRYPCKNSASGCGAKLLLATKEDHEANCDYRTYTCIFRTCGWTGLHPELQSHVRENHPGRIKDGEKHVIQVTLNNPTCFCTDWAFFSHGQAFRVNIFENIPNSVLYASVVYMGPRRKAADYNYTVTLKGNEGREMYYKRRAHNHSNSNRLTASYGTGDCFVVKGEMAQHFVVDGKISLEFSISSTMPG